MEAEDTDSTSDEPVLLGFISANIVGLNHYGGTINGRELVGLVRDPLNQDDPNAIKVINTRSIQVGHIQRKVAAVLAPLIDDEVIIVEGIVPNCGSVFNRFYRTCQVHVFTPVSSFESVSTAIRNANLELITQDDASFTLSESEAVKETKATQKFRHIDQIFRLVNEGLSSKKRVIEPPRQVIKTELLTHQKEGLGWLVDRESSDDLPPFWEEIGGEFVNILTKYKSDTRPEPLRGGILADSMGLGKTLTLLSLIAFDKVWSEKKRSGSRRKRKKIVDDSCSDGLVTNATLVVCPPSVFSTWFNQVETHTVKGSIATYFYYGDKRTRNADELKKYDLVLTTYATLSSEEHIDETPAKKIEWRRIILDEAHTIKNYNALQTKAVIRLNAKRRWAVTGTPIQNGSMDLFSLMAFLHFEPFSTRAYWRSLVQRPLNQGLESGLKRLQTLMAAISLRRTKDTGLPFLPPKTIETHYVELDSEERELYDRVNEDSRNRMLSYINDNRIVHLYSTILSMILRLRQVSVDMALCPKDVCSPFPSNSIKDISKNPGLLKKLGEMLQDSEDFECPICLSSSTDVVITVCAHIFCRPCILKALKCKHSRCPLCRHKLTESKLFSAPPESTTTADSTGQSSLSGTTRVSSKTSALIKFLAESKEQNPATKSIVYSQFRKMLLLLEVHLKAAGFKTLRLDGSMSAEVRASVIDQFESSGSDGPTILLASLRASGAGINLMSASRVYFMEPWWNPAVEEQAMDRVHRIGQKQAVKIVRLIAKDSIEEKILKLQEKKKELATVTLGKPRSDVGTDINDLRFLMNI